MKDVHQPQRHEPSRLAGLLQRVHSQQLLLCGTNAKLLSLIVGCAAVASPISDEGQMGASSL
jgi:hypothetical protein